MEPKLPTLSKDILPTTSLNLPDYKASNSKPFLPIMHLFSKGGWRYLPEPQLLQ